MRLLRTNAFDREYWLGHCEGFQVRSGRRRLGFVEQVLDDGRILAVERAFWDAGSSTCVLRTWSPLSRAT